MFHNNVVFVLMVAYCLYSIGDSNAVLSKHVIDGHKNFQERNRMSELDCNQFRNDHDVLRQFPFAIKLNPTTFEDGISAAYMNEDGTFVDRIVIKNEHTVPLSLFCLSKLTSLGIEYTSFENDIVPDALGNLKNLKYLSIYSTPIEKMTKQLATLIHLEMLSLVQCSLTHLPDISNLRYLKGLIVPYNNLTQINELSNLHLQVLDIAANYLTTIPILKNKEDLLYFAISNNPVKNAEPILLYPNLKFIYMSNASLTSIPSDIDKLQGLVQLLVFGNQLTHLPPALLNLPNLEMFMASRNLLSSDEIESYKEAFKQRRPTVQLFI